MGVDQFKQSSLAHINLSAAKITFDPQSELRQSWDKSQNGLTTTGQVGIAIGAVVISCALTACTTAPASVGAAAGTAVATTAATTATISATNATLNADSSNPFKIAEDSGKTALKDTTSKESMKNMAVSAAVAGAAAGVGEWIKDTKINYNNSIMAEQAALGKEPVSTGRSNLMIGSTENSKIGVNTVKGADGQIYTETAYKAKIANPAYDLKPISGFEKAAYDSQVLSPYDNNPIFRGANYAIPTVDSGARGHDAFVDAMKFGFGMTAITAPPYLILNACAAAPAACGLYVNSRTDREFFKSNSGKER